LSKPLIVDTDLLALRNFTIFIAHFVSGNMSLAQRPQVPKIEQPAPRRCTEMIDFCNFLDTFNASEIAFVATLEDARKERDCVVSFFSS
jgi:hypothetical protein